MTRRTKHRTGAAAAVNPDHVGWHRFIVAGVAVTLLAAVATSWHGLVLVAAWQGLPEPMRWVTPVMIDVPLIVLTTARGALAKRGIRARGMLAMIAALTVFSSAANVAHTLVVAADLTSVPVWCGAITNGLAPWLILAMTEVLWLVLTRQPAPSRPTQRARPAKRTKAVTA